MLNICLMRILMLKFKKLKTQKKLIKKQEK